MAANWDQTTASNYSQLLNSSLGGTLGGLQQVLGGYQNAQQQYQYSTNTALTSMTWPVISTTPEPQPKKKAKRFLAALRDEIDAWHGNILAA